MHDLQQHFEQVRQRTAELVAPLSAEDCCAQSMADTSPAKWHLAHTSWFFETFVLEPREADFAPFDPAFRVLFNSYYHGVGAQHPRPQRGLLTRPALAHVLAYRLDVNQRVHRLLGARADDADLRALVTLGLHHEQQHQELLLTDALHLLSCNPTLPAYLAPDAARSPTSAAPLEWIACAGGMVDIGHPGHGFCFDNELPRHQAYTAPYALADRLVNNAEYAAFVADGGYQRPELWLAEGWDWLTTSAITQPLYWRKAAQGAGQGESAHAGWHEFSLCGEQALDLNAPVVHLCYFEADAYARWAQARLPSEIEWEAAAAALVNRPLAAGGSATTEGTFVPRAQGGMGLRELFGAAWQWTQSSYAPYPGFRAAPGAVGEYNGKFMVNQYVLRGSSCATAPGHARLSYRNFFPTTARWQITGLRLARDLDQ